MSETGSTNSNFVETAYVKNIVTKALFYLQTGFPVHFSGPAGTGKTTLALHVAEKLTRPVILVHGNDQFTNSDLVGGNFGIRRQKVVDNFIHSVWKGEESIDTVWSDGRLTRACRIGATLVYDEFTRSRAEANNILLAVLEERLLDLSQFQKGQQMVHVHPEFAAIFTSNPREYAGVHKCQDALRDRMITIDLGYYDRETEVAIGVARSTLPGQQVERIVDVVSGVRAADVRYTPSLRATIMIAKICRQAKVTVAKKDALFREISHDVLMSEAGRLESAAQQDQLKTMIDGLINRFC